uniref:Ferric chelate reductase 1 n=1 Tax=Labrus bergylta TaxID=56723 RepID=A0A3Q3GSV8_9LABR
MSPAGFSCLLFIAVLACHWVPAGCYANGKVAKACHGMEPSHHARGQSTPSPYILTVNATTYGPGDQILVVLSGSTYFTGFLLQARDTPSQGSASIVGTFTLMDPKRTQLLTCNKLKVNMHIDTKVQSVVILSNITMLVFLWFSSVTVVQEFKVFWVKLPGPIINEEGFTSNPTQQGTRTTPPSLQTTTTSILDTFCCISCQNRLGPADGYVAFALSLDTWMGNDDVYMCVKEGDRVSVSAAFVLGRTHPEDESQSGLSSVSWRLADGAIQCRFSRPVRLANQEPARYDLDRDYYLFLANGQSQKGVLLQHSRQPLISTQSKLITGPPEVLRGSRAPTLMKMHGSLMMLAWMLTGSVGTFIASFYKPDWPNQSLLGQKVWFQVHRGLMMLTVALTFASFCLPFFYRSGWSKGAGLHLYLGLSVLALSLIQPLMAAVRPPPDSGRRYIFNWAHFGFGTATEIMAVIAMSTGMRQSSLLLPQPWATHVLIGYVTWLVSFRTGFLIHMHCTCTLKNSIDQLGPIKIDPLGPIREQQLGRYHLKKRTIMYLHKEPAGLQSELNGTESL